MKTKSEKALGACMEYDRLMLAIKRNTEEIGEGMSLCDNWEDVDLGARRSDVDLHLSRAFQPYESDGEYFPTKQYHKEPAILEIIGDCAGCLKAYRAIQARKANKKALGIVKRKIRAIGRAAK